MPKPEVITWNLRERVPRHLNRKLNVNYKQRPQTLHKWKFESVRVDKYFTKFYLMCTGCGCIRKFKCETKNIQKCKPITSDPIPSGPVANHEGEVLDSLFADEMMESQSPTVIDLWDKML